MLWLGILPNHFSWSIGNLLCLGNSEASPSLCPIFIYRTLYQSKCWRQCQFSIRKWTVIPPARFIQTNLVCHIPPVCLLRWRSSPREAEVWCEKKQDRREGKSWRSSACGKAGALVQMSGGIGPAASLGGNLSANALVKLLETPFGVQGYFKSVLLGFFVFFVFCFFFFFFNTMQCAKAEPWSPGS